MFEVKVYQVKFDILSQERAANILKAYWSYVGPEAVRVNH
jgi:hypothetical protein